MGRADLPGSANCRNFKCHRIRCKRAFSFKGKRARSTVSGGEATLVFAFRYFLDDLRREGLEIRVLPAGDKSLVYYDLLIKPLTARVDHIGFDRLVGCGAAPLDDPGLNQKPGRVANGRNCLFE